MYEKKYYYFVGTHVSKLKLDVIIFKYKNQIRKL